MMRRRVGVVGVGSRVLQGVQALGCRSRRSQSAESCRVVAHYVFGVGGIFWLLTLSLNNAPRR